MISSVALTGRDEKSVAIIKIVFVTRLPSFQSNLDSQDEAGIRKCASSLTGSFAVNFGCHVWSLECSPRSSTMALVCSNINEPVGEQVSSGDVEYFCCTPFCMVLVVDDSHDDLLCTHAYIANH